jgi:hypothetical protein
LDLTHATRVFAPLPFPGSPLGSCVPTLFYTPCIPHYAHLGSIFWRENQLDPSPAYNSNKSWLLAVDGRVPRNSTQSHPCEKPITVAPGQRREIAARFPKVMIRLDRSKLAKLNPESL